MASKKKQASEDAEGGGSSKLKTIGMAVALVAVGAVVGPKFLGGGSSAAAPAAEATTTTVPAGPMVVLDEVTLNLADGHLLQVGLALELDPTHEAGGGHGEATAEDDPTKGYAKAIDATIDLLGDHTMADLSAAGGREQAKEALLQRLEELYPHEVAGVYFHRFVMQ